MADLQCQFCTKEGFCTVEKTSCTVRNNDQTCYTYNRAEYDEVQKVYINKYTEEIIQQPRR